jgi:hypothetical protein
MNFEEFLQSLTQAEPPQEWGEELRALWHAGKDDWHAAHLIAQSREGALPARIHAHLHRVEGDHSNAAYWYRRAGLPVVTLPLRSEWEEIVRDALKRRRQE